LRMMGEILPAINHPGGSNVLHVGAFGDMLQPGNGVVGDIHLAKPSFELFRPRGVPVTEGFAFGQVGKGFVAFDIGIPLGGDRDLAELIPRNALGGNVWVTMNFGIAILSLSGISILLARPPEHIPPSARLATLFRARYAGTKVPAYLRNDLFGGGTSAARVIGRQARRE